MARPRIGLLGGSFDPVHNAHLALAKAAIHALDLHEVQLIPAADPWQKAHTRLSPAIHRLAMLKLACAQQSQLVVNPLELQRSGPTYTYDTVSQLANTADYFWILGSDQLQNFSSWHQWQAILQHVQLAVAVRPGYSAQPPPVLQNYLHAQQLPLHTIPFSPQAISSTQLRALVRQGQAIHHWVPAAVEHYIHQHKLYE